MWEVRSESPADAAAVRAVYEQAFPTSEEADLTEALRASDAHVPELCLVALSAGAVVGHIAFSRGRLDSGHDVLLLAPMGVAPAQQGQGAGSALVSAALRGAARTPTPLVVVVGHAGYYPRFGFERGDALGLAAPFDVPDEAWMAYRLPAYTAAARGTVAYPAAFG